MSTRRGFLRATLAGAALAIAPALGVRTDVPWTFREGRLTPYDRDCQLAPEVYDARARRLAEDIDRQILSAIAVATGAARREWLS